MYMSVLRVIYIYMGARLSPPCFLNKMVCGLGAVLISRMRSLAQAPCPFQEKTSCGLGAVPIQKVKNLVQNCALYF